MFVLCLPTACFVVHDMRADLHFSKWGDDDLSSPSLPHMPPTARRLRRHAKRRLFKCFFLASWRFGVIYHVCVYLHTIRTYTYASIYAYMSICICVHIYQFAHVLPPPRIRDGEKDNIQETVFSGPLDGC